jgi:hypothetical protein
MARIFELQETKGTFQVRGIVSGVDKDRFYTDKKTKTGKDFRAVNFGCAYNDKQTVYMSLNGMPQQKVYFSKRNQSTGKTETKDVPWANRNKFNEDGWRLIGVNLGLKKTLDENGKSVNDKKTMVPYDACEYINENMEDDMSVFVKGALEFSSFTDNDGNIRRGIKYVPSQVSLCQDVNFEEYSESNKPVHDFTQNIVFVGIDKENVDGKDTGRFVVSAKIVTYNDIVNTEFIITNAGLAKLFKTKLKAYNAITVHGKIEVVHSVQVVEEEDCWGETNEMNSTTNPTKVELVITGATPSTIDKETYSEKNVADAMKKIRASKTAEEKFVANDDTSDDEDWGDTDDSDDETPW